jgi:hypothetical protein
MTGTASNKADSQASFKQSGFTGKRWSTAIIKKLWGVAWDMWEHWNHVLRKEQEALFRQQENTAIRAEFAIGFDHFPKHFQAHTRQSEPSASSSKPEERSSWLAIIQAGRVGAEATARMAR